MKPKSCVDYFVAALAMVLAGCAATSSPPQAARADSAKAQITILYDAFGKSSSMQKDWGYAALIEYGGKRILFDTGNNGDTLAQNAKAKGIHLIALVSDKPGTLELRELSLAINTAEGMVIIVGCSHPGIEKIVEAATKINPRIHLVAGGFHLVVSKDEEIEKIVTALHDTYKVAYVAPGHCTGEPTFTALKKAFGDRNVYAGLGATMTLSGTPRSIAEADQNIPATMDEDDLQSYRALLGKSDDHEYSLLARLAD